MPPVGSVTCDVFIQPKPRSNAKGVPGWPADLTQDATQDHSRVGAFTTCPGDGPIPVASGQRVNRWTQGERGYRYRHPTALVRGMSRRARSPICESLRGNDRPRWSDIHSSIETHSRAQLLVSDDDLTEARLVRVSPSRRAAKRRPTNEGRP